MEHLLHRILGIPFHAQIINNQQVIYSVVAAGDAKIDNPKYKARFGTKAKMLSSEEAETLVGYAVGGVCPFAVREGVDVYLDVSLQRFETDRDM